MMEKDDNIQMINDNGHFVSFAYGYHMRGHDSYLQSRSWIWILRLINKYSLTFRLVSDRTE